MPDTILDKAKAAVYGDRNDDYGTVTENFQTVADLWSTVLKTKVTPEQVGLCMVQLKVARQMYKPKRDNLVDGAGYFATLEKLEKTISLSIRKSRHKEELFKLLKLDAKINYFLDIKYHLKNKKNIIFFLLLIKIIFIA
jgi:hypothetical protein